MLNNRSRKFHFEALWVIGDSFKVEVKRLWESTDENALDKL